MTVSTEAALAGSPSAQAETTSKRTLQSFAWDEVARTMPDFSGAPSTLYYRDCEIELFRRHAGDLRGRKFLKLDLWNEAINTRILKWVSEQGADVYGMDISEVVSRRAQRNAQNESSDMELIRADIRELPYLDNSFDVVYTMGTIEHIDEYRHAIEEIRRVLKPGGRAIIGVPFKYDIFLRPLLVAVLEAFGKYPYAPEKSFTPSELRKDVSDAGLTVRDRTGILIVPGILRMADVYFHIHRIPLCWLTGALVSPFAWLEKKWRWPGLFGYLLTVVADKPGR
ncbi:MAG TPA: class I SAM-dependent methyltransferase [Thermoanaerobaculia bacterium]|nr:class I SAM-dependent methyltransferase [Thermoanaerobaculia bacterium]